MHNRSKEDEYSTGFDTRNANTLLPAGENKECTRTLTTLDSLKVTVALGCCKIYYIDGRESVMPLRVLFFHSINQPLPTYISAHDPFDMVSLPNGGNSIAQYVCVYPPMGYSYSGGLPVC